MSDNSEDIIDQAVTRAYRRFKDWSKRGFGPDEVTWCEVRADLVEISTDLAKEEIERHAAEIERLRELIDNDLTQKAFIDGYLNGGSDCELELPRNPYSAFDEWSEEIGLSACRSKSAENDQQTGLTLTDEDKALKGGEG